MKILILLLYVLGNLFSFDNNFDEIIKDTLSKKFLSYYTTMHIDNISLKRYTKIPKNFKNYKIKDIYITDNDLKRDQATITVLYTNKVKNKKIHYRYKIDATVDVLKANQHIPAYKTLTEDMVDFTTIKFTNFYQKPITPYFLNRYRARAAILNGKIITTRYVSKVTDVKRGDTLSVTLVDGGVSVTFNAKALKDAYIGDIIRVKRKHNNVLNARIISKTEAEVTP